MILFYDTRVGSLTKVKRYSGSPMNRIITELFRFQIYFLMNRKTIEIRSAHVTET